MSKCLAYSHIKTGIERVCYSKTRNLITENKDIIYIYRPTYILFKICLSVTPYLGSLTLEQTVSGGLGPFV